MLQFYCSCMSSDLSVTCLSIKRQVTPVKRDCPGDSIVSVGMAVFPFSESIYAFIPWLCSVKRHPR